MPTHWRLIHYAFIMNKSRNIPLKWFLFLNPDLSLEIRFLLKVSWSFSSHIWTVRIMCGVEITVSLWVLLGEQGLLQRHLLEIFLENWDMDDVHKICFRIIVLKMFSDFEKWKFWRFRFKNDIPSRLSCPIC